MVEGRLGREEREHIEQELLKIGLRIERRTKEKCPVDTGRLRASYTTELVRATGGTPRVVVGSNVEYAPYVEFGTSRMEAQPHLQPAIDEVASELGQGRGLP